MGITQRLNISLRLNGKDTVNVFSDFMNRHDFRNLISMHSLLKVKKGDRVDLYVKQGGLQRDSVDGNNVAQHTQFTGKLLLEDVTDKRMTTEVYFNIQKNAIYCKPQSSIPFEIGSLSWKPHIEAETWRPSCPHRTLLPVFADVHHVRIQGTF